MWGECPRLAQLDLRTVTPTGVGRMDRPTKLQRSRSLLPPRMWGAHGPPVLTATALTLLPPRVWGARPARRAHVGSLSVTPTRVGRTP